MNIGPLNTRARFEYRVSGDDPKFGTPVESWAPLGDRWVSLQDVMPSRSEGVSRGLEVSKNMTRLRLRYCTDIDSTMRLVINRPARTVYQIIGGPAILGDKDGLEFMIEQVSTDG